jgi:hypothetical protein
MTTWLVVLSFLPPPLFLPVVSYPLPLVYKLSILIVLPPIRTLSRPSRAFGRSDKVLASGVSSHSESQRILRAQSTSQCTRAIIPPCFAPVDSTSRWHDCTGFIRCGDIQHASKPAAPIPHRCQVTGCWQLRLIWYVPLPSMFPLQECFLPAFHRDRYIMFTAYAFKKTASGCAFLQFGKYCPL